MNSQDNVEMFGFVSDLCVSIAETPHTVKSSEYQNIIKANMKPPVP